METVEYLMVSEITRLGGSVDKALVNGSFYGNEVNRLALVDGKYLFQSLMLLLRVGEDIEFIPL